MSEWIKFEEIKPCKGDRVLVYRPYANQIPYGDPNYKICTYFGDDIFIGSHYEHKITHWMPLPEPPQEK